VGDTPPPTFEVHGELSDEAIEALASLLLSVADQEMADDRTTAVQDEDGEAT